MKIHFATLLCCAAFGFTSAQDSFGQILPFIDTFDDGSATDGTPVTWLGNVGTGGGADAFDVRDGSYEIFTLSNASARVDEINAWSDVSIETQLRVDAPVQRTFSTGIYARQSSAGYYIGSIHQDGTLRVVTQDDVILADVQTSLDPVATDIILRFNMVGNEINLAAWEADGIAPEVPQISLSDNQHSQGGMGLFLSASGATTVAFRYVDAVPEPSSLILASLGLLGVCVRRRG